MAVSRRLRYEILRRDGHTCRYCGAKAPKARLTVDHVTPVSLGGKDAPENLVAACSDCNSGKASSNPDAPLVANVTDEAIRWAAAMRAAAAIQAEEAGNRQDYAREFLTAWTDHYTDEAVEARDVARLDLPPDWRDSLDRFHDWGIEISVILRAVETTMAHQKLPDDRLFRYFCGICWRRYDERQEIAHDIYEAERGDG